MLLDMLFALEPSARVFAIDTHYLFPETYELWREVEQRYDTKVEVFEGRAASSATRRELWERKPDLYLAIAKVEPLVRALLDLDCWITGVRRDQSPTRANAPKLGWDEAHELWKANPLADWSDDDCWAYIRERELPYNALHDRGYESIGDTHSTIPGAGREGRWAGTDRTECGLHVAEGVVVDHEISARTLSHLDELEAEAIHIMREVAAERERPVLLFSGGKDSIVLLAARREGVPAGEVPVPGHARRHGPQLPRGDRVPRPPRAGARRAARRRERPGVDRPGPRRQEQIGPARVAQPAADDDAARRDRGARLRRRDGRRAPRRGACAREGAHLQLPRRLRPVEPARAASRALEPLQRAHPQGRAHPRLPDLELDRARRVAVHRAREPRAAVDLLRARRARCSAATGCSTPRRSSSSASRRGAVHAPRCGSAPSAT